MNVLPASGFNEILVGNDAGWLLEFRTESAPGAASEFHLALSSDQYHAEISAALPGELAGGVYTFTIEGLVDEHYRSLKAIEDHPGAFFRLYLFWRDVNAGFAGYLENLTGLASLTSRVVNPPEDALVAVLKITGISRKAGNRHYETTIEAKERVFCALSNRAPSNLSRDTLQALLEEGVLQQTGIVVSTDGLVDGFLPAVVQSSPVRSSEGTQPSTEGNVPSPFPEETPLPDEETVPSPFFEGVRPHLNAGAEFKTEIQDLANRMAQATRQHGRGMLLIRNGTLHFGTRQSLMSASPKQLHLGNGLVEIEETGKSRSDPYSNPQSGGSQPEQRQQYRLTLKGRPDLKPGDFVEFAPPPEDLLETVLSLGAAMAGAYQAPLVPELGGDLQSSVTMYVTSVTHTLGRKRGFVTGVAGVEADPRDPWDHHSPQGSRPRAAARARQPTADGADGVAQAIQRNIQNAVETLSLTEVGEVRGMQSAAGSEDQPHERTLTVFHGLVEPDGHLYQAPRLAIQRQEPRIHEGVAYTSPFAWGKCGLVLPRYPGTRVVMTHRNGQELDPIDIGALWEAGHGPESEPGDWWLILPVDVPQEQRAAIDEDNSEPIDEHTGPVTQDLIDAEGNRIIEVGELTIRITRDSLKSASDDDLRPARPEEQDSVTIEHADGGSKIVMKSDGTVVIEAAKNIELTAAEDIIIDARNVNVRLSETGAMDVS